MKKKKVKVMIGLLCLISLVFIISGVLYLNSSGYVGKKYYDMAISLYTNFDLYKFEKDEETNKNKSYYFNNKEFYKISNYDKIESRFTESAHRKYRKDNNIQLLGDDRYISYSNNVLVDYVGYKLKVTNKSFNKIEYKVTTTYCNPDDETDLPCYDSELTTQDTKFAVKRSWFGWKISKFEFPVKDNIDSEE